MSKFNCTQQQLYAVARAAWASCLLRIAAFFALKPKYIAALVTTRLAAITAAEALPDEEQRKHAAQLLRDQMIVKAETCRDFWQRLKLYITEAFPENELDTQLSAAGQSHYDAAGKDNWDSVKRIMIDGSQFIDDNSVALLAADNMPATFEADFNTEKTAFETMYSDYINATLDTEVQTQTKTNANNAVYADLTSMLKDGQRIFKDDEAVSNLFTFEQILLDIAGPGTSGIKGLIKDGATNQPIQITVTVTIFGTEYETTSDEDGRFQLPAAADTYSSVVFTAPGYNTHQETDVEVQPGVMKIVNVTLTPTP